MHDSLMLDEVDRDGAIREGLDAVQGDTRAGVLAKAALAAGGMVGAASLLAPGGARAQGRADIAILNFALVLEELEAAFYADALARAGLTGGARQLAQTAGAHERGHVAALRKVLGEQAVARPRFDFRGTTEDERRFLTTAVALEEVGVAAYKGQAPLIRNGDILRAALAIHSVEARHAAWARFLAGLNPVLAPIDPPLTRAGVLRAVEETGFIVNS